MAIEYSGPLDDEKQRLFHDLYEEDRPLSEIRKLLNLANKDDIYEYLHAYRDKEDHGDD
ncbi:hypothetical protein [Weissella viridescens]|uniref:hypothetical protein n=1 Tax=Weissella viridescens TaxID=1629 RepID=UPI003AF2027C